MTPLCEGLRALGLEPTDALVDQLGRFSALLARWNQVYNLTAVPAEQTISHHFLDSLSILPWVGSPAELLDVGSGGGLPGVPLALALPDTRVVLLDTNSKKTRFLEQVRIELGLANVEVATGRVEQHSGSFEVVTSRAFASLADFAAMTAHLLAPPGRALAMKGVIDPGEIDEVSALAIERVIELDVPGIDASRHLVELRHRQD